MANILFFYPASNPFHPSAYDTDGVGGFEAALILASRALAQLGHAVTVFNHIPEAAEDHGVHYRPVAAFWPAEPCDVFILFRTFQAAVLPRVQAAVKLFWSCDLYPSAAWKANIVPHADRILAISPFHRHHLIEQHRVAPEQVVALDLGIHRPDYEPEPAKVPGKLLYCSVPNRGLRHLASLFPRIRAQVPHAELFITSDFRLWGLEAGTEPYVRLFQGMEGVHFLGKVSRAELVRHQREAQVMAYPCEWPENFCIAALECLAAGAVPVTTDLAALTTTVGGEGVLLPGMPAEPAYQERFVAEVVRLLRDEEHRRGLAEQGRRRVLERYGWEEVVKTQWEPLLLELLAGSRRSLACGDAAAETPQAKDLRLRDAAETPQAKDLRLQAGPRGRELYPRACRVSLTMIVKNEEATLADCLRSVADLVDEMVVVDTGSTDRTREMAASFGAKVIDFAWCDSFAAARNESLRHATGDWAFWLDADERLDAANRQRLLELFGRLGRENAGYVMKQHSGPEGDTTRGTAVEQTRLFRNHPAIRWEYRIHEQILPALGRVHADLRFTDIIISHVGYDDPALVAAKLQRNLRLILMEDAEHPEDPFTLFNLGWAYLALNRTDEAVSVLQRSLKLAQPGASIVHKLYSLLATAHRQLQQPDAALAACRAGLARSPGDAELLFLEGLLLQDRGDFSGAERCFRQLLPGTEAGGQIENPSYQSSAPPLGANVFDTPSFGSLELGLRGHHTRFRLAQVLFAQGKAAEAEALWRVIVADHPGDMTVWRHLAELFLDQQRWTELDEVIARLRAVPPLALEAAVLQAQGYLARREWASARRLLEEVVARAPNAVWPWVYLSQALIQEGSEPEAIERALRRVVELDAGQVQSWHNLAVHYRHHGRLPEALATCRQARSHHPHDGEMLLLEGIVSQEVGDLRAAEAAWLALLEQQGGSPATPAEAPRQRRGLARHLLAGLYRRRRPEAAEAQWRAVLVEQPEDPSAWSGLGKLWLAQQRWAEVEQAAAHLARLPGGALETDVLRARVHLARREFEAGRRLVEAAIARHPEAELPRVVLSYLHLQEGKDRAAAERALREVLRINPRNTEAENNLAVLLRSGT
jgi:tetratricopeptide (TPR) repeat protein/glycosyltransferase involved in cell wall biosynthesis